MKRHSKLSPQLHQLPVKPKDTPLLLQGRPSSLPPVPSSSCLSGPRLWDFSPRGLWEPAPVNYGRPVAAGLVSSSRSSRGSDEHSLRPSTINQIFYGSNKSTTKTSAQIKQSAISEGCWKLKSPNATFLLQDHSSQLLLLFLLYHNALGLAFTLLKEHEYIIIHTKEQVIVYELPAFPATKAIFIRKLNFILAPIWLPAEEKKLCS